MTDKLIVEQAYDGEFMAELELSSWDKVDEMLQRATKAHADRNSWLPAYRRIEILKHLTKAKPLLS